MSPLAVAVALSLASAAAYALGAILQERVASSDDGNRPYAPLRSGRWWVAVTLNGSAAALHVVALALGPLGLVQALGTLTIPFALLLSAASGRRPVGATGWGGALAVSAGLALLLALAEPGPDVAPTSGERAALALVSLAVGGALVLTARQLSGSRTRGLLLAAASGLTFGMGSVFAKTVATDLMATVRTVDPLSLVMVAVFAAGGLLLAQAAYREGGLALPLATLTLVNPIAAALVGLTVLGESFRGGAAGALAAVAAGLLAAFGLIVLSRRTGEPAEDQDPGGTGGTSQPPEAKPRPEARPKSQPQPAPRRGCCRSRVAEPSSGGRERRDASRAA